MAAAKIQQSLSSHHPLAVPGFDHPHHTHLNPYYSALGYATNGFYTGREETGKKHKTDSGITGRSASDKVTSMELGEVHS